MSPEYAEDTLRTLVAWGRYAELFYDEEAEQFSLEDIALGAASASDPPPSFG